MEFCDRLQTNIPLLVNEVSRARHVATAGIILYTVSICVWYAYSAYKTGYPVDTNAGNNAAATCPAGNNAAATCPAGNNAAATCPAGSNPAATCPVTTYPTYVPYLPTCPVGGPWYKNHAIEFTNHLVLGPNGGIVYILLRIWAGTYLLYLVSMILAK